MRRADRSFIIHATDVPTHIRSLYRLQVTAGFLQAAGVRFNRFFSRDRSTVTADLVQKFHADLGKGFSLSPSSLHPPPSFEMERCLYYTLVHAGGAPDLTRCAAPCRSRFLFMYRFSIHSTAVGVVAGSSGRSTALLFSQCLGIDSRATTETHRSAPLCSRTRHKTTSVRSSFSNTHQFSRVVE